MNYGLKSILFKRLETACRIIGSRFPPIFLTVVFVGEQGWRVQLRPEGGDQSQHHRLRDCQHSQETAALHQPLRELRLAASCQISCDTENIYHIIKRVVFQL